MSSRPLAARRLVFAPFLAAALAFAPHAARAEGTYAAPATDAKAVELFKLGKEKKSSSEVPGSRFRLTRAEMFIDAPMSAVRAVVLDYAHYQSYIPAFQRSKLLKLSSDKSSEVFLQIPTLKGAAVIWAVEHFDPPALQGKGERIAFHMVKSNVQDIHGAWTYRPVDDRHTLLTLEIFIATNIPAPVGLITSETEDACGHGVRGVRARAEAATKQVASAGESAARLAAP